MDLGAEYFFCFNYEDINDAKCGCLFEVVDYYLQKTHKRLQIKPCFTKKGVVETTGDDTIYEVLIAKKVDYDAEELKPFKFTLGKDLEDATQNAEVAFFDELLEGYDQEFFVFTPSEYKREIAHATPDH